MSDTGDLEQPFGEFMRGIGTDAAETRSGRVNLGPTGLRAAAEIRALRQQQGMSTYDVANAATEAGWPIHAVSVTRVEGGQRRLTADDLAVLALVLDTSPVRLMLGAPDDGDDPVDITPAVSRARARAWADWAGGLPLEVVEGVVTNALDAATRDLGRIRDSIRRERENR